MPTVTARGIELYYERAGAGPPVLFISGTGGDLRQSPSVLEGPLPRSFDVVAYDQRGLGRSAVPPGPYTMADYADDGAALLDAVGWERPAVVGVSFGGMVAQELALRHPGRVAQLVLCCTSSGGKGGASFPLHELAQLDDDEATARRVELSDRRYDAAWREANPDRWSLLVEGARARGAVGAGEPGREDGARLQLEARAGHDTFDRLGQIDCPTLVCAGRYDGIAPPENQEMLAGAIPGAALRWFEGGHLFLLQDRDAWPAIIGFLGEGR